MRKTYSGIFYWQFTVVVLLLLGIGVILIYYINRTQERRILQEGIEIAGGVARAQDRYFSLHGSYIDIPSGHPDEVPGDFPETVSFNPEMNVDLRDKTVFTSYAVDTDENKYEVRVYSSDGRGNVVLLTREGRGRPVITIR